MTKTLTFLTAVALSSKAMAHAGHVAETANHSHWGEVALVVALAAIVIALLARAARNSAA